MWKMGHRVRETVESVDLSQQRSATLGVESVDEIAEGLRAVLAAEVDRLKIAHAATADAGAAVDASRRAVESFSAASTWGTWWT
jgi:hypothetical protein